MGETNCIGRRIVAFVVDWFVIGLIVSALLFLNVLESKTSIEGVTNVLGYYVVFLLYFAIFALFNHGKTIGKMVLQLELLTSELNYVSIPKLLLRVVAKVFFLPISIVSLVLCFVNEEQKSLHDILAGTIVVVKS